MSIASLHTLKNLGDLRRLPMFALRNFRDAWKAQLADSFCYDLWGDAERLLEDVALDLNDGSRLLLMNRLEEEECCFAAADVAEFSRFSKAVAAIEAERIQAACRERRAA